MKQSNYGMDSNQIYGKIQLDVIPSNFLRLFQCSHLSGSCQNYARLIVLFRHLHVHMAVVFNINDGKFEVLRQENITV